MRIYRVALSHFFRTVTHFFCGEFSIFLYCSMIFSSSFSFSSKFRSSSASFGLAVARGGQHTSMITAMTMMTMLSLMMMTSFGLTVDSDKGGLC